MNQQIQSAIGLPRLNGGCKMTTSIKRTAIFQQSLQYTDKVVGTNQNVPLGGTAHISVWGNCKIVAAVHKAITFALWTNDINRVSCFLPFVFILSSNVCRCRKLCKKLNVRSMSDNWMNECWMITCLSKTYTHILLRICFWRLMNAHDS